MAKICPKCNKEWPDDFLACPLDGETLVNKPQTPSGFNLNLGDANAISGGVNMSDNHSVSNTSDSHNVDSHNVDSHNVTTHNVDSHNVITTNITQIEREKRPEEILLENKQTFRLACQEVMKDGLVTADARISLNNLQFKLGLDKAVAATIFDEVRKLSLQSRRSTTLTPVQKIVLNNTKTAISNNRVDMIERLLPQLKVIVEKFEVDEVHCLYYMLQSMLHPAEFVNDFEGQREDRYWQTYWADVAYRRLGDTTRSDEVINTELDKWLAIYPEENTYVLAAINYTLDEEMDNARSMTEHISGVISEPLTDLVEGLYYVLNQDVVDDSVKENSTISFYVSALFDSAQKRKEQELAKLKAEEERRKREEEKAAKAEAERLRLEEEARQKEEAEARMRKAEEEARLAELNARKAEAERLAQQAEADKRKEEELQRKLEAERKAQQEKERKDAEAKAAEEAAQAELLAHWPKFCNKCGSPIKPGQKFCNKCGNKIVIK